jgi:hypothetical protein
MLWLPIVGAFVFAVGLFSYAAAALKNPGIEMYQVVGD